MSYYHFSKYEQGQLQVLLEENFSHRIITYKFNRHHSSITREIFRDSLKKYHAEKAGWNYQKRRISGKVIGKFYPKISKAIEEKMIILDHLRNRQSLISEPFITSFIKEIFPIIYCPVFVKKEKRRRPPKDVKKHKLDSAIHQRPQSVKSRQNLSIGSWTQWFYHVETTVNRGNKLAIPVELKKEVKLCPYFSASYCSWQRRYTKNANGLLREFFPKKSNLALVKEKSYNEPYFELILDRKNA